MPGFSEVGPGDRLLSDRLLLETFEQAETLTEHEGTRYAAITLVYARMSDQGQPQGQPRAYCLPSEWPETVPGKLATMQSTIDDLARQLAEAQKTIGEQADLLDRLQLPGDQQLTPAASNGRHDEPAAAEPEPAAAEELSDLTDATRDRLYTFNNLQFRASELRPAISMIARVQANAERGERVKGESKTAAVELLPGYSPSRYAAFGRVHDLIAQVVTAMRAAGLDPDKIESFETVYDEGIGAHEVEA